jgi:hypothetical protein
MVSLFWAVVIVVFCCTQRGRDTLTNWCNNTGNYI